MQCGVVRLRRLKGDTDHVHHRDAITDSLYTHTSPSHDPNRSLPLVTDHYATCVCNLVASVDVTRGLRAGPNRSVSEREANTRGR